MGINYVTVGPTIGLKYIVNIHTVSHRVVPSEI
jgi:hypothetical protein